jgi:hypothetical protein
MTRTGDAAPTIRISNPADLLDAVPYLLGFHPQQSVVLLGLHNSRLVVTVRVDLGDLATAPVISDAIDAMYRGGARTLLAAIYDDRAGPVSTRPLPWDGLAHELVTAANARGCSVGDVLLVRAGRWWSYGCDDPGCGPGDGAPLLHGTSVFSAEATYAGLVALPDRDALAASLDPLPDAARQALVPQLTAAESAAIQAVRRDGMGHHDRSLKRAIFAAARAAQTTRGGPAVGAPVSDAELTRYGVALRSFRVRDPVWMALDDGRLDGRQLWRELARRLPAPYDAAPLFLFGWRSWRAGNGALAGIAAERAVQSDPGYSAADLLLAALSRGVDPRRLPRLRLPRSA